MPYTGSPGRPQGTADGAAAREDTCHPGGQVTLEPGVKLKLMGLTPERFAQMLETQGYACAMGRTPFEKDQRICIDRDHACCPPELPSRCCGK